MGNMSYCRWENTAGDLRDCVDSLEEESEDGIQTYIDKLSDHERAGFNRVVAQARKLLLILEEEGNEI